MAEEIVITGSTGKQEKYEALVPQVKALVAEEPDLIACLSNIMAALKTGMELYWVGCYMVKGEELVLGPFQGPVACTRIPFGKGVCGTAWKENKVLTVDDVKQFPGHIACSAEAQSEIALPANKNGQVALVLDADSDRPAGFDSTDEHYLLQIISVIEDKL